MDRACYLGIRFPVACQQAVVDAVALPPQWPAAALGRAGRSVAVLPVQQLQRCVTCAAVFLYDQRIIAVANVVVWVLLQIQVQRAVPDKHKRRLGCVYAVFSSR